MHLYCLSDFPPYIVVDDLDLHEQGGASDRGRIVYNQKEIQGKAVHQLVALGIARTFQNVELFGSLSVLENVLVGEHVRTRCGFVGAIGRWPWVKREEKQARERAMELLKFFGLFFRSFDPFLSRLQSL